MYLYIKLQQCHKTVHQYKGGSLLVSVLDTHVSCQLAICAPAKLTPSNVAKQQHQDLQDQRYGDNRNISCIVPPFSL